MSWEIALTGANAQQEDPSVVVQMFDAEGNPVGTVKVAELAKGTLFIADLKNLPRAATLSTFTSSGAAMLRMRIRLICT